MGSMAVSYTHLVTVSDYGEEKTNSRKELQTLPLDDLKNSIISLSREDEQVEKLFNYEFKQGKLKGLDLSLIHIYPKSMKHQIHQLYCHLIQIIILFQSHLHLIFLDLH